MAAEPLESTIVQHVGATAGRGNTTDRDDPKVTASTTGCGGKVSLVALSASSPNGLGISRRVGLEPSSADESSHPREQSDLEVAMTTGTIKALSAQISLVEQSATIMRQNLEQDTENKADGEDDGAGEGVHFPQHPIDVEPAAEHPYANDLAGTSLAPLIGLSEGVRKWVEELFATTVATKHIDNTKTNNNDKVEDATHKRQKHEKHEIDKESANTVAEIAPIPGPGVQSQQSQQLAAVAIVSVSRFVRRQTS